MMAEPVLKPAPMTFEQVAELDPDQFSGELVNGEWIPVTHNTWRHSRITGNAYTLLRLYEKAHPEWHAGVGDPGAKLSRNPDTLRAPDAAIIRVERIPKGKGVDGWLEGAPDVAVEVIGDSQSFAEMGRKALEYLRAGARMVWVLDPDAQALALFTQPNDIRILGPEDTLDGGEVLPGFACKVSEFFE